MVSMDKCYEFAKQICTEELINYKLSLIEFNLFICVAVAVFLLCLVIISYIFYFKDKNSVISLTILICSVIVILILGGLCASYTTKLNDYKSDPIYQIANDIYESVNRDDV